jgi:hypothetical protein
MNAVAAGRCQGGQRIQKKATDCCWRLSWREQRVSQPGKGHLWLRSPVWTRECRARWPLVVKARSQVGQTCFFLGAEFAGAGWAGACAGRVGEAWVGSAR